MSRERDDIARLYRETLFVPGNVVGEGDPQLAFLRLVLPPPAAGPVLDAGCGNGRFCRKLHELGYRGLCGVDLFEAVPTDGLFEYRRASLAALPFADASFAAAFACSSIYYAPDLRGAVRELARVVRPGGVVLATTHPRHAPATLLRRVKRALGRPSVAHLRGVRFPSAAELCRAFRGAGLELLLVDGFARGRAPARRPGRPADAGRLPRRPLHAELSYHAVVAGRRAER